MIVRDKLRDQYIFYEKIKKINNYKHISLILLFIFLLFYKIFTNTNNITTGLRHPRFAPPHKRQTQHDVTLSTKKAHL